MGDQLKKYSKEYIDGVLQGFATLEIYVANGGTLTVADIATERKHYQSLPVLEPSKRDLSKLELGERSAEVKEFNRELAQADKLSKDLSKSLDELATRLVKQNDN